MTDLRLLVPGAATWLGAAVAAWALAGIEPLTDRHGVALVLALVGGCVAATSGIAVTVIALLGRHRWPAVLVSIVGVGGLGLGVLFSGMNAATWTASPLAGWVEDRAVAVVTAQVAGEARERAGASPSWRSSPWIEVRIVTRQISARGESVEMTVPLLVRLPADVAPPAPGAAVELTGRLGPVSPRDAAAAWLAVSGSGAPVRVIDGPGPVDRLAHAMRVGLVSALAGTPADAGSLVAGLAVGDESGQPPELTTAMQGSGLSHLTAVSGGNVAILLGVVLVLAVALRLRLRTRVALAAGALAYFVLLVGPQPSVLRAAAMGAIAVLAMLTGGRRSGPSVLAAAVMLLLAVAPWLALSWGFALSVCATAGLILLVPTIVGRLETWPWSRRWPPAVSQAVSLTVAAQLATLPLLVAMGGATGWVAVPANLLAMPAVPPVTVLGLIAAGLAPMAPGLAAMAAHLASVPAAWIAFVARTCAEWPLASLPWPDGWRGLGMLAVVALAVLVLRVGRRQLGLDRLSVRTRTMIAATAGALLVMLAALPPSRHGWPPPGWLVIMCDVGQGDALLVRSGDAAAVVVDVGPDPASVDRCLSDAGIDEVPMVVLTHFHADHVRGLSGVFEDRSVGEVLLNPVAEPKEEMQDVRQVLAGRGMTGALLTAGDARRVGDVTLRVLWPRRRIAAGSVPNNASIVMAATVRGRSVLLAGDIEPEAQTAVGPDLRAQRFDAVKVPHHGSRYQSPLLTSWAPAPIALISVGEGNEYGHPAAETVAAWADLGALVARTDRDGDVAVVTSGSGVGLVARNGMLPTP